MKNLETASGIFDKILSYRGRVAELAVGHTANQLMSMFFDWVLYPFVIYKYGLIWGGLVMMALSLIACLGTIWFYDWSKRDWLGIEAIKDLKDYDGKAGLGRITGWFLRKSEPVIFLFLSVMSDPFITTAYLRRGKFNGMIMRDWTIFFGSFFICNGYWILACYMGISLLEWAWQGIKGFV
jgi:hypothetical protein